jgi:hypothetical protein
MAEHPIGLVERGHRSPIAGVVIWMVDAGEAAVGATNLLRRCRRRDPEDLVVGDVLTLGSQ